jgi:flagellar protein FliS
MANTVFDHYLETEVLSADPIKLVTLLYRAGIEATAAARRSLEQGCIPERSRQISRAWGIVQELSNALDHQRGGELSRQLVELYGYIQMRLIEGNTQQAVAPLAEAEALLSTLSEAWRGIQPAAAPPPASTYTPVSCSV